MDGKNLVQVVTRKCNGWHIEEDLSREELPTPHQVKNNEIDILYFSDGSSRVNCPYVLTGGASQYCSPAVKLQKLLPDGDVENQKLFSCPWYSP